MPVIDPNEFKSRVERILSLLFGGLHNLPNKIKWRLDSGFQMAELRVPCGFSTFDFNQLTLLVLAAHDECVRADISPRNPREMTLSFWPRLREGRIVEWHPTIEQALESFREHYQTET